MIRNVKVIKRRRLKPQVRKALFITKNIIISILVIIGILSIFSNVFHKPVETCKYDTSLVQVQDIEEISNEEIKKEKQELLVIDSSADDKTSGNKETETVFKEVNQESSRLKYRMTYYYPGDETSSGSTTASGKSADDFQLNNNGWYTYKSKLVVATASKRLLSWDSYRNSTQPTYNLYDELVLTINGIDYDAIVLDVCGACMKDSKIDLFVKNKASGLDTSIEVRRK